MFFIRSVKYLIILDENTEMHHSLSHRDGDGASVWTDILNSRIGSIGYLRL